jgi:alpha-N-arabinofuranosidase
MTEDDSTCSFEYSCGAGPWRTLLEGADATLLSTRVAGGFVGAVVGPHARIDP